MSNRQKDPKRIPQLEYRNYLRSQEWRDLRQAYLNSGMSCNCFCCHRPWDSSFVFHHCTYQRLGYERLSDIRPVCRPCHDIVHETPISWNGSIWNATLALARRLKAGAAVERPIVQIQTKTLTREELERFLKNGKSRRRASMKARKAAKAIVVRGDKDARQFREEVRRVAKSLLEAEPMHLSNP